jgi:hypothetical protein
MISFSRYMAVGDDVSQMYLNSGTLEGQKFGQSFGQMSN